MSFGQGGPEWGSGGSDSQQPQWRPGSQQPPRQPEWGPAPGTPDWSALAEASAARARRHRWLMIGGGVLATVAVGAVVAFAVVSANSGDKASDKPGDRLPATADIPPSTTEPAPSFAETTPPPPPDPKEFISSADKDKAPLSAGTLFPGDKLTMGGRVYDKGATSSTKNCASVTHGPLGAVLTDNHCTRVIRATYARDGVAVTVGVAVFDTEARASKAAKEAKGNVVSLPGSGVPSFCTTVICRSTTNSYGRYAYFTIGGFTKDKDVTEKDSGVYTAGDDVAEFAFRRIIHRGEVQASAAAGQPG